MIGVPFLAPGEQVPCMDDPSTFDLTCHPPRLAVDRAAYELAIANAKALCSGCPVQPECAAWAIERREDGVWGGLTDADRIAVRRRTNRNNRAVGQAQAGVPMQARMSTARQRAIATARDLQAGLTLDDLATVTGLEPRTIRERLRYFGIVEANHWAIPELVAS